MFDEADFVPISALEHFSYCPRQCALIHVEQVFDDNVFTVRGILDHERVDQTVHETRPGVRREYGLPLWSARVGLIGRADVVEFHGHRVYPVEHKSGRKRTWTHEAIQLCAQAICLEDMLGTNIHQGAVYYHGSRTRREVQFDHSLRREVATVADLVRKLLASISLPEPANDARCPHCSLRERCLPKVSQQHRRIAQFRSLAYRWEPGSEYEWDHERNHDRTTR